MNFFVTKICRCRENDKNVHFMVFLCILLFVFVEIKGYNNSMNKQEIQKLESKYNKKMAIGVIMADIERSN